MGWRLRARLGSAADGRPHSAATLVVRGCSASAPQRDFHLLRRDQRSCSPSAAHLLVSYGASDSRASARSLTESDRRELEVALAKARADVSLHARGDGSFPDGPFRLQAVPRDVIKHCLDNAGRIANAEGPWEGTDAIRDARLPRARLLNACRVERDVWDVTCQSGGYARRLRHVRARLTGATWSLEQNDQPRAGLFRVTTAADDVWPDCRSLSAPIIKGPPPRP